MTVSQPRNMSPPKCSDVLVEYPIPYVLLVTINRPKQMNALPVATCFELDKLWKWFDGEDELRVGIITGSGTKAFSAGMDLKERELASATTDIGAWNEFYPPTGFAGLTRRTGKKPIIAAVNGNAHGGGFDIAINCDLVLASSNADFRLPDVLRGTAALQGTFPRIMRNFGLQRAMLLALTGYVLTAHEAKEWGLVVKVVESAKLIEEAIQLAGVIASVSPDSVIVSRSGVRQGWEGGSVEDAVRFTAEQYAENLMGGENLKEGLVAFRERRAPRWLPSKL
ncbi:related to enoyl-CoA hydratase [Rhynchosporium agropyri]|uniref:Related to enoyl-CoA hydratase n=1 Tax=Rhynchosporium agropyri TaxID=914238 RepID=A0A1E1L8E2_9HELO|nr:related to enoyl-CoA hydratase [Rhynchosporium agropyri]